MNLKAEFIKLTIDNIQQAELRNNKSNSKEKFNEKKNTKTFYDYLISSCAFSQVTFWIAIKCGVFTENFSNFKTEEEFNNHIEKILENFEMNEYELMNLFYHIFDEIYEYKIYDLFEIYGAQQNGKIGAKEIYLIICFTAAFESHQVLEFLYIFGKLLFNIVSGGILKVWGIRIKQFAKLIGFSFLKKCLYNKIFKKIKNFILLQFLLLF